ncbi:MAG TPA: FAD-dependent oxidoreductase [Gemmatimonadaceae bacterium]
MSDTRETGAGGTRTVLLGCSFAGLELLYRLARRRGRFAPEAMTVVDAPEQHPYIPLVHEAASGSREPQALQFDRKAFCERVGARWVSGLAAAVDPGARLVTLEDGRTIPYDRLVIAVGSVVDVPDAARGAPVVPAKFLADAMLLRRRLHVLRAGGARVLRVVVVGDGVTSVEWSAALAAGRVDGARLAVTLVGKAPRLLPTFRPVASRRAAHALSALGVELLLGRGVRAVRQDHVLLDGGAAVHHDVVVWAGGVRPTPLLGSLPFPRTPRGHLAVTPRLAVPGAGEVYAIGDCARIIDGEHEWPTMERAIEAIWQGATLARRFAGGWAHDAGPEHHLRRDFLYGISLGPRRAAVVYKGVFLEGRWAEWVRWGLQWGYYARLKMVGG